MKIFEALEKANKELNKLNIEDVSLKSKMLLLDLLDVKKEYLIINSNKELEKEIEILFFKKLELLKNNYPIQYIINKQNFYGFEFFVNEKVLIPQPDTEILVDEVISFVRKNNLENNNLKVLDLCTGSGIIGICIKKILGNYVDVFAIDISKQALDVAKINAEKLNTDITFIESDLFEVLEEDFLNSFDIIVSNPPYIKTDIIDTLSEEVKNEPYIALDGKKDGLYFYRKIINEGKKYLKERGKIFFEIGYDQKEEVEKIFEEEKYNQIYSKKDFAGNDRIVVAEKGD